MFVLSAREKSILASLLCRQPQVRRNVYYETKYIPLWLKILYRDEFLHLTPKKNMLIFFWLILREYCVINNAVYSLINFSKQKRPM